MFQRLINVETFSEILFQLLINVETFSKICFNFNADSTLKHFLCENFCVGLIAKQICDYSVIVLLCNRITKKLRLRAFLYYFLLSQKKYITNIVLLTFFVI